MKLVHYRDEKAVFGLDIGKAAEIVLDNGEAVAVRLPDGTRVYVYSDEISVGPPDASPYTGGNRLIWRRGRTTS